MEKVENKRIEYINVLFNEKYANFFDVMENGDIGNRKADIGFIEKNRPMFGPRMGTLRVGDTLVNDWVAGPYASGKYVINGGVIYRANILTSNTPPHADWTALSGSLQSNMIFYTDKDGKRRQYRIFDNNFMYLNDSGVWTTIKTMGTNEVDFQQHKVPVNLNGSDSTSRTSPTLATGPEKIKVDAADPIGPNQNVGTIILITSGIYKGCFAPIISYDSAGLEYSLGGAGVITALPASTTYKRFETLGDVLQVTRPSTNGSDLYFYGITELTYIEGYATASLKNVSAITSTQSCKQTTIFNNAVWTFSGSTLYYGGGFPGNPLFFNYTGSYTPGVNGAIVDIFPYKNRLVVVSTNSIFSIKADLSVDRHITSYGGIKLGYVNTGDDIYILTTNSTIISLTETINGVVDLKNVGETIDNYVKNFKTNIAFGYDSRRVFLYGQETISSSGTICIYDTKRKMWMTYTGISPKCIVSDSGKMYIGDSNSDIVRVFSDTVTTDVTVGTSKKKDIAMALSLKELDNDDVFTGKVLKNTWIAFEEYTQSLRMDMYLANTSGVFLKEPKEINIVPDAPNNIALGESIIGTNPFGLTGTNGIISKPIIRKVNYESDTGNVFKVYLTGKNGTPFYISQIAIGVAPMEEKSFINPLYSI